MSRRRALHVAHVAHAWLRQDFGRFGSRLIHPLIVRTIHHLLLLEWPWLLVMLLLLLEQLGVGWQMELRMHLLL